MNSSAAHEILDAAEHLPSGSTLMVPQVSWDDYERLLDDLAERPHFRITYDCGRLEILSPSSQHERHVRVFDRLVDRFAGVFGITVEMLGHTTWKKRALEKGLEADCCYFIKNADFVIENFGFDVELAPPPDLAVEIDVTNSSLKKLSIYAALSVPEVWRYDGQAVRVYELIEGKYCEINESRCLVGLTAAILTEYLDLAKSVGQTKALRQFSQLIRRAK
jgi:Uma2 family endonuclease